MPSARELDVLLAGYVTDFIARNRAAQVLKRGLDDVGIGFFPIADHLTFRTNDIDRRAEEFTRLGYAFAETLNYNDWFAKVYRKPGYPPLFIDQAYDDGRGKTSIIPRWVGKFGDRTLHHIAVKVEDIDRAMAQLQRADVRFAGTVVGERGAPLRQVFTAPEEVDGEAFSVVELTERHEGFLGFSPPQADGLMRSTARERP